MTATDATVRPTDGTCVHWDGARYCRKPGAVRYQQGWRCTDPRHDVRAALGLDPLPESPGIPAHRGVGK